jgi:hypothetical protein
MSAAVRRATPVFAIEEKGIEAPVAQGIERRFPKP